MTHMTNITHMTNGIPADGFYMKEEYHPENPLMLGFWIYVMSDCFLFASLFAAYAVFGNHAHAAGGPGPQDVFDLKIVAVNTALLLLSSITCGFAMVEGAKDHKEATLKWLAIAGLLGAGFVAVELSEFSHMISDGASPQRSAFLSSFFTLVGTHGTHVSFGILWLVTLMVQVARHGVAANRQRLACWSLFWHFLDVVWIWIFTFVYLMGVLR